MEPTISLIESLLERIEKYSKTTLELSKLRVVEKSSLVTTSLLSRFTVVIMLSFFLLVFNIGLALWLGEVLGKSYYGFFVVAVFYLIAGTVFRFFLHGWIKKPASDFIITQSLQ
jgi:hypothetical protein